MYSLSESNLSNKDYIHMFTIKFLFPLSRKKRKGKDTSTFESYISFE